MSPSLTVDDVWEAIEDGQFAVLSWVTKSGEPRSTGMVYTASDRQIYMHTARDSWKVRYIAANPAVAMTITIPRRVPLMPWIKVPAAVISFHGEAKLHDLEELPDVVDHLTGGVDLDPDTLPDHSIIRVTPLGHFTTYGVGVSVLAMRNPEKARARVAV